MLLAVSASRTSFATGGQNKSCESENYHGILGYCSVMFVAVESLLIIFVFLFSVKLRIKSFNIPELFIKVPENATIGSLKVNTTWAYTSY
jgi:hypothetical protein